MDAILNLLSGGILGTISQFIGKWFTLKEKREEREHELKLIKANTEATISEINARIQVEQTITEREIQVEELKADVEESKGRSELIAQVTGSYIPKDILEKIITDTSWTGIIFKPLVYLHLIFMDALRGTVRPFITAGSVLFSFFIFIQAFEMYITLGTVTPDLLLEHVIKPMVNLVIFMVSTAMGFWFADKASVRRFQKKD